MAEIKVTKDNFKAEVLESNIPVLLDFWATWCGPCQMLTPIIKELDEVYENVEFYKVNVDESQECAMRYGVTAMPTLIFFKNGEEVERQIGFLSKEELAKILDDFDRFEDEN